MTDLKDIFFTLDLAGTFIFAAPGALVAARKKHDIITFGFFACVTGIGGGTLRDLLIDVPVFWIHQPAYIAICLLSALLVWLFGYVVFKFDIIIWLDAAGMAAFSVVGASKALANGVSPLNAVIMGVITCVFGGVIRDVLAGQQNMLLRREIYITAALLGSTVFVGLYSLNVGFWLAAIPAVLLAFWLRGSAILFGWQLPGFGKNNK